MKSILKINIHSFIDVITNSSTELFVCDTDKAVETIKDILKEILDKYNLKRKSFYDMNIFEEPFVFNLKEYRQWVNFPNQNKDNSFGIYNLIRDWFFDDEDEEDIEFNRKYYIKDSGLFHDRLRSAATKEGRYNYSNLDLEVEKIYKEILAFNKKPDWWIDTRLCSDDRILIKDFDGCIIIIGSEDNSIPYEIFETIENIFKAKRFHLG